MPIPADIARAQEDAVSTGGAIVATETLLEALMENAMRPKEVEVFLQVKGGAASARMARLLEKGIVRKIRLDDPESEFNGLIFWVAEEGAIEAYQQSDVEDEEIEEN